MHSLLPRLHCLPGQNKKLFGTQHLSYGRLFYGFNTAEWEMCIQMDLTDQGSLWPGEALSSGGNANPLVSNLFSYTIL